jgi:hypothetical protein
MYTQRRVAEYLKRTTKEPKEPKISKKTKDFQKEKQERFPHESASSFIPRRPDVARRICRFCGEFNCAAYPFTSDT